MKFKIFIYEQDVIEQLGKINLFKATEPNCKDDELITYSGLGAINNLLNKIIYDYSLERFLKSFYIEYTSIATLLDEKVSLNSTLSDFVLVSNQKNGIINKNKIGLFYNPLYNVLKEEGIGLFYNKEFFKESTAVPYALMSDFTDLDGELNQKKQDLIKKINGKNKFYNPLKILENGCANGSINNIVYKNLDNLIIKRNGTLEEYNQILHALFDHYFCDQDKSHKTYLLSIPTSASSISGKMKKTIYNGLGAIFLLLDFESNANLQLNKDFFETLAFNLSILMKDITYNYIFDAGITQYENAYRNAMKSGVAAIMSRNVSHNLGSHVLDYIKNELSSTETIIKNGYLSDLVVGYRKINDEEYGFKLNKDKLKTDNDKIIIDDKNIINVRSFQLKNKLQLGFITGLSKLLNYIQERQDYIATIASDTKLHFGVISFKEFVFDEINYDKKAKRHRKTFEQSENLLLKYIAKSEEFSRENIIIKFRDFKGEDEDIESQSKKELSDIELDLPGQILGRQAIFSILENFIRNSAKHGKKSLSGPDIEIIFDIRDYDDDYYEVTITDNVQNITEDLVKKIKDKVKENIVDDSGQLIETNKGIKEIKISAAWLRNIPIESISNDFNPPILTAETISSKELKIKDSLAYKFYIIKPKQVAIVSNNCINENLKSEVKKYGWRILTIDEYYKLKYKNFRIIVLDEALENEVKMSIRDKSVVRVISKDIKTFINNCSEINNLEILCQREFIDFYFRWIEEQNYKNYKIIILDDRKHPFYNSPNVFIKSTSLNDNEYKELLSSNSIVYRVHNDNPSNFQLFKDIVGNICKGLELPFIEGISGGNSTVRIIRNEEKNPNWEYQIIESALTKILIIDERIWAKYSDINGDGNNIQKNIFEMKNIFIWNITPIEVKNRQSDNKRFIIKNLNNEDVGSIDNDCKFEFITKTNLNYDFIVIHQGILDKIYEQFIKVDQDSLLNSEYMLQVANIFDNIKNTIKAKHRYIVHSGRAKPFNIPNNTSFVQYSSISNSLADCKITLTDLLYSTLIG